MLVDLTRNQEAIDENAAWTEEFQKDNNLPLIPYASSADMRAGRGVYWSSVNFMAREFMEFKDKGSVPFEQAYGAFDDLMFGDSDRSMYRSQYGVADNLKQVIKYLRPWVAHPERRFFITLSPIFQEKEYPNEGWRWHKWGPYVGRLKNRREYLNDEDFGPDFQGYVIVFHLYELK